MPGIGSAQRRPVVAEDIHNLQRWTGHRRMPLRRRRISPAGDHAGCDSRITRPGMQYWANRLSTEKPEPSI